MHHDHDHTGHNHHVRARVFEATSYAELAELLEAEGIPLPTEIADKLEEQKESAAAKRARELVDEFINSAPGLRRLLDETTELIETNSPKHGKLYHEPFEESPHFAKLIEKQMGRPLELVPGTFIRVETEAGNQAICAYDGTAPLTALRGEVSRMLQQLRDAGHDTDMPHIHLFHCKVDKEWLLSLDDEQLMTFLDTLEPII